MNRLSKYILITYSVIIFILISTFVISTLNTNYQNSHIPERQYNAQGDAMIIPAPENPFILSLLLKIILFGFPIFIVFMSAFYLFKENDYAWSLFIPIPYIILGFIISIILMVYFLEGEEGFLSVFLWLQFLAVLIFSIILNSVIHFFIRNRDETPVSTKKQKR